MSKKRNIIFFKDYFLKFFDKLPEKTKDKIDYALYLVTVADKIPSKYFEQITEQDKLFAIRVEFQSNIFRIFCCFDKGNVVVLFNGFQKKLKKHLKKRLKKQLE